MDDGALPALRVRALGIDTHQEPVVYMRVDCHVCRSEGFVAHSRIDAHYNGRVVTATLNTVHGDLLAVNEIGLSEAALRMLAVAEGEMVTLSHTPALESLSYVRHKIYGHRLSHEQWREVMHDIVAGRYSDIHLAAFVTSCGGDRLDTDEVIGLTEAMVVTGERLSWGAPPIVDKHCVGGIPGNRTTPIVVAIIAANGLVMPKTSSRAITSPSGTADTVETMTRVELSLADMRRVVEQEGGCMVWGGSVSLSPADDLLIRVERALDLDSEGQMVASVISKKVAAGSSHVLLDIPVGPSAKVRSRREGHRLAQLLTTTGVSLGVQVRAILTDGSQPIGVGIGPALEAHDVLKVLRNAPDAPEDLRERALLIAGHVLELSGRLVAGEGITLARQTLTSGKALEKFLRICEAQGGFREPGTAPFRHDIVASRDGVFTYINNRFVARLAKLAGAPAAVTAGVSIWVGLGQQVSKGDPLYSIHAETSGELDYALAFLAAHPNEIRIESESL